jgi:hypothetical protein
MKSKLRHFIWLFLPALVVWASMAEIIVEPARTEGPVAVERNGCPDWGGRRLRSTNSVLTVQYSVGVGRVSNDGEKGQITLTEKIITRNIYTPDVLALTFFPKPPVTELIRDPSRPQRLIADPGEKGGYTSESIRQIRAPETFVDIVVLSEWEYEIRFYHPEQSLGKQKGFYTFTGEPYSVTQVRNPNPPHTDTLEITTSKDGITKKSEYKYDEESDMWTFFVNDVETVRKLSAVNPSNPCERTETRFDLKEGSWFKTVKIFKGFPWGQDIIKKIEDPDGEALTTTYKYFDDPNGPHYSFLKTTIHPDGTVERHNRHPDPFKNAP